MSTTTSAQPTPAANSSSATAETTSPSATSPPGKAISGGAIGGIVGGVVGAFSIIGGLTFFFVRRGKKALYHSELAPQRMSSVNGVIPPVTNYSPELKEPINEINEDVGARLGGNYD